MERQKVKIDKPMLQVKRKRPSISIADRNITQCTVGTTSSAKRLIALEMANFCHTKSSLFILRAEQIKNSPPLAAAPQTRDQALFLN